MKRSPQNTTRPGKAGTEHQCPVKCPLCTYPSDVWPARFRRFALEPAQTVAKISGKANHVLFLLEGALRILVDGKDIFIQSRQAMFFARDARPWIQAVKLSQIVWLEFSNRIVLGACDVLSEIHIRETPRKDDIPILCLSGALLEKLQDLTLLDSPCFHICIQKELYMLLKTSSDEAEIARFFRPLLDARKDFTAFVTDNFRYGDTIEEAARKAHMSKSHFLAKFKNAFGVTAHRWLLQQKAAKIQDAIAAGETDAKILVRRFDFRSSAALYHFCRRYLGGSFSLLTGKKCDKKT